MKKKIIYTVIVFFLLIFTSGAFAGLSTTLVGPIIDSASYGGIPIPDLNTMLSSIISDQTKRFDSISGLLTDCFNIASSNQMPIGEIKINNFTIGFTVTGTAAVDLGAVTSGNIGSFPIEGGGVSLGLFFGMSLGEKWDLLFAGVYVPKAITKPLESIVAGISFDMFSVGVRARYVFKKKNAKDDNDFMGISISPGFAFAYSRISYSKLGVDYSADYSTGLIPPMPTGGTMHITGFDATGKIYIISVDLEIKFHFKVFYILNLFLAAGGSLNFSYFRLDGMANAYNHVNIAGTDYNPVGNILISGKADGSKIIPRIMGGFELNLWVRILLQGMLAWSKGYTVYGATFSLRFSF